MEGISANLLEQLDFKWKVIRIQSILNADLFCKMLLLNLLTVFCIFGLVAFLAWTFESCCLLIGGVGCINLGGLSIMEGISANLLEQTDFRWKVIRIQFFLNADLFCKMLLLNLLTVFCIFGLVAFLAWTFESCCLLIGGVGCINLGGLSIMEGISANLLEQLDFKWKVIRIQSILNADLFCKMLLLNLLTVFCIFGLVAFLAWTFESCCLLIVGGRVH